MTPERWQLVDKIFHEARDLDPDRRAEFLDRVCASDAFLRREVDSLLAYTGEMTGFIDVPALQVAAEGLASESFQMIGETLGPYRIISLLGRGGMGEVYRAQDKRLAREVAIKILPADVTRAMRGRFEQEARAAGHLNHPNIVAVYDIGHEKGLLYIVTELVDGKSLRERIGTLSIKEATDYAGQIAIGLAAAHDSGIVHRDLKPENLMIAREGRIKILDFGLAKESRKATSADSDAGKVVWTEPGMVVGTAGYMSPEQVRGLPTDFRSDIFSFGVILHEMLTGARPFVGDSAVETMNAILINEPKELPDTIPAALRQIVVHCLEKDPHRRFQSSHDLAFGIRALAPASDSGTARGGVAEPSKSPQSGPALETPTVAVPHKWWKRRRVTLPAGVAVVAALIVAGIAIVPRPNKPALAPSMPVPVTSFPGNEFQPAFSPDGQLLAFAWDGEKQDNVDIWVKQLASGEIVRITTDPAPDIGAVWSPDGSRIAFRRLLPGGVSQIIVKSYLGGPERKISEVMSQLSDHGRSSQLMRDLCWSPDGKWLVTAGKRASGGPSRLMAISLDTTEIKDVTTPPTDAEGDFAPSLSQDGLALAFVRAPNPFRNELYIVGVSENLDQIGEPKQITSDNRVVTSPAWAPDGRAIIFASDRKENPRSLWRVNLSKFGGAVSSPEPERLATIGESCDDPTISRDGRRLAYTQNAQDLNIWAANLPADGGQTQAPTKVISSTRAELMPDFSPDGKKIAFGSDRSGYHEIWACERDGSSSHQLTFFRGPVTTAPRWSPNGKQIAFVSRPQGNSDVYIISAQGGGARRLTRGQLDCVTPNWSRDGKWIYFSAPVNNLRQVWKIPADGGKAVQITKGGGLAAVESVDGKYIYYSKTRGIYSSVWRVPAEGGTEIEVLSAVGFGRNFAVTEQGIYFIPWTGRAGKMIMPGSPNGAIIRFHSFTTGTDRTVFTTEKPVYIGLAVSPDQRTLLYTQIDRMESDIWMIDNFR